MTYETTINGEQIGQLCRAAALLDSESLTSEGKLERHNESVDSLEYHIEGDERITDHIESLLYDDVLHEMQYDDAELVDGDLHSWFHWNTTVDEQREYKGVTENCIADVHCDISIQWNGKDKPTVDVWCDMTLRY